MNKDQFDAFKKSDPAELTSRLGEKEKALLNTLLKDPNARQQFLSSEEAQRILRMLKGG